MPSKKKKYNARFPAGRIKKIMQTDEEVGKVAQAVPVIISRALELFVKSLLVQATQVTTARNAKTLSPSHLKQCILHEARFDFLRELVKNIPDVTAAEEKELQSAENSPNSSSDAPAAARRPRDDPPTFAVPSQEPPKRRNPDHPAPPAKLLRTETVTTVSAAAAIDLSLKTERRNVPNFYQETLPDEEVEHSTVIRVNPSYANPQPSTSNYTTLTKPANAKNVPKIPYPLRLDSSTSRAVAGAPLTPLTPVLNIDFTKNLSNPEIQVLDASSIVVPSFSKAQKRVEKARVIPQNYTVKALSRSSSQENRRGKEPALAPPLDSVNSELDEDYDT